MWFCKFSTIEDFLQKIIIMKSTEKKIQNLITFQAKSDSFFRQHENRNILSCHYCWYGHIDQSVKCTFVFSSEINLSREQN